MQRQRGAGGQRGGGVQVLLVSHDADVGPAEIRLAQPGAGNCRRLEAHLLDQFDDLGGAVLHDAELDAEII